MTRTTTACAISMLYLCAMSGCSGPSAAAPVAEREEVAPQADGVIRISQASQPFIAVQGVEAEEGGSVVTAPARVAFKDGGLAQLAAPLAGRVVRVHVRTGDRVEAGAALLTLDCPEAATVRAADETARASLREAHVALERERRMLREGVGTERDVLTAETNVEELEAQRASAQAAASFVGPGSGTTVVLRAPISGTVISRKATEGMAVQQAGEPIVEIGDPSALWVVGDIFERDLPLVREGARATVEFPSIDGPISGRVTSIGAVVTQDLRTAPVRITLDRDGLTLRPGMYGRLRVDGVEAGGFTLPTDAVLIAGKETVVYVETGPLTYARRVVTVGPSIDGKVRVVSGLTANDRVVVHGALLLDGAASQLT